MNRRIALTFAVSLCILVALPLALLGQTNPPAGRAPAAGPGPAAPASANAPKPALPAQPNAHPTKPPEQGEDVVKIDENGIRFGYPNHVDIQMPKGPGASTALAMSAILAPFVCLFGICALLLYSRTRRVRMLHQTLRAMVDKGVPIPPELLSGSVPGGGFPRRQRSDLRSGAVLVALGIAMAILWGKVGLIAGLIGVAFLIVWLVERKDAKISPQSTSP